MRDFPLYDGGGGGGVMDFRAAGSCGLGETSASGVFDQKKRNKLFERIVSRLAGGGEDFRKCPVFISGKGKERDALWPR